MCLNCNSVMKTIVIAMLSILICSFSIKKTTVSFNEIVLASGGGFTGMVEGFVVDNRGKVYKCVGKGECKKDQFIRKLSKKEFKELKNILYKENLLEISIQQPGNIYNQIKIATKDSTYTIIWNPFSTDTISTKLNVIFDKFHHLIKRREK